SAGLPIATHTPPPGRNVPEARRVVPCPGVIARARLLGGRAQCVRFVQDLSVRVERPDFASLLIDDEAEVALVVAETLLRPAGHQQHLRAPGEAILRRGLQVRSARTRADRPVRL